MADWIPVRSIWFLLLMLWATPVSAQDAATFFRANCYSCHTIGGGRVTGPDLKGVTSRRERSWLVNFILDAKAAIDSGDPYAQQLLKEARGVIMPTVPSLDPNMAEDLLDLIEKEEKLEESNFLGLQISDRPISPEEIDLGGKYFQGSARLLNRGPACLSCHSVADTGALGGGRVGPDLTKVFERLGGRRALAAWLLAPATPTMASVFQDAPLDQTEIAPISAFLEDAAKNRKIEDPSASRSIYVFLAMLGTTVFLALLGQIWKNRTIPCEQDS